MNIGQIFIQLGLNSTGLTKGLTAARTSVTSFADRLVRAFGRDAGIAVKRGRDELGRFTADVKQADGFFKRMMGNAAGFLLANSIGAIASSIRDAAAAGIKWNATLQTSQMKWETLLGSSKAAVEQLNWMKQIAEQTPFEFHDLDRAAARMKAFGFTIEQSRGLIMTLGDAAAATGTGAEGIDRIATALGQMNAKTKAQTQELMQLTEMGIPAWQMLADSMGLSVAEVMKMVEQGLVPASQAIPVLVAGMDKAFGGNMQKQAKTFNGLWSTLKDNWQNLLGDAIKPTFGYLSETLLPNLITLVKKFANGLNSGGLRGALMAIFPESARETIYNIFQAIGRVGNILQNSIVVITPVAKAALSGLWDVMSVIFGWIANNGELVENALTGILVAFLGYRTIIGIIKALTAVQWAWNAALNANPIGITIVAVGLLIAAGIALYKNWDMVKHRVLQAWGDMKSGILNAAAAIISQVREVVGFFNKSWGDQLKTVEDNLRAQAKAEQNLVSERREAYEEDVKAKADAEEAKRAEALKTAEDAGLVPEALKVEGGAWAASADAAGAATGRKNDYLDSFAQKFDETENAMIESFRRSQEKQRTEFERNLDSRQKAMERLQAAEKESFQRYQQDRLNDYKDALEDEKGSFADSLRDRAEVFEDDQQDALETFKDGLQDRKGAFKDSLEDEATAFKRHQRDLLDAFKGRQEAEVEALKNRHDAERRAQDDEYDAALRNLEAQERALRAEEESAQRIEKVRKADEKISKSKHSLNQATMFGSVGDIAIAQKALEEALREKSLMLSDFDRQDKLDGIRSQKDALRDQHSSRKASLQEKQAAEKANLKELQEAKLKAYDLELENEKIHFDRMLEAKSLDFDRRLEADLLNFQRKQEQDKILFERQLDAEKVNFGRMQEEKLLAFQRTLEDDKIRFEELQKERKRQFEEVLEDWRSHFKNQQEDTLTAYKLQLSHLKDSFRDKLDAQAGFVSDWNSMVDQMKPLVAPGQSTNGELTVGSGDNASTLKVPKFAKGAVVSKATLGVFGEAGTEAVTPLTWLSDKMMKFADRIVTGMTLPQMPGLTMPGLGSLGSRLMEGSQQSGPQNVTIPVYLDGKKIAEHTLNLAFGDLKHTSRAMG